MLREATHKNASKHETGAKVDNDEEDMPQTCIFDIREPTSKFQG